MTKDNCNNRISMADIEKMSHFGVVRDWNLLLKDGSNIELDAEIIKTIVQHENQEASQVENLNVSAEAMHKAGALYNGLLYCDKCKTRYWINQGCNCNKPASQSVEGI